MRGTVSGRVVEVIGLGAREAVADTQRLGHAEFGQDVVGPLPCGACFVRLAQRLVAVAEAASVMPTP